MAKATKAAAKGTIIARCECSNAFQDKRYGRGLRLHNRCTGDVEKSRCTVCGNTKGATQAKAAPAEKKAK